MKETDQSNQIVNNTTGQNIVGKPKNKKVVSVLNYDPKQDILVSVSNSEQRINNNNNNDDHDVSNTKQSSDSVHIRNNFNSNSNNKNVKVTNARFKEIDQSNQTVDNTTGQGIVGNPKNKKLASFFNSDPKQDIFASVKKSANSITNNNNNDDDNVYNTKKVFQFSSYPQQNQQ